MFRRLVAAAIVMLASPAIARSVDAKFIGSVDLQQFRCTETVSSFVHRICYDAAESRVIVLLRETFYQYCNVDPGTVAAWLGADSKGRFYNQNIKSNAVDGRFDCR
ncbi:KTSC domain-containing protein [Devosia sp. Root105]|uniref:KTSC domain-containing protein n=1 Tax=Devosia sp. Root105 TaxID=1736423 RepID=UPI0006FD7DAA|nr:KTSC domain-containing protein [Devosia sp. Root105]KQU96751.1 hypothetical protein ASC68_13755 [Devosia sp. Root105]